MSYLTSLPHDPLALIASLLDSHDRDALRRAFPVHFTLLFAASNHDLWREVHLRRFQRRPAHHDSDQIISTYLSALPFPSTDMSDVVRVHDLVDDLLLRDGAHMNTCTVVSQHLPSVRHPSTSLARTLVDTADPNALYAAYGRYVNVFHLSSSPSTSKFSTGNKSPISLTQKQPLSFDVDVTALHVCDGVLAAGLINGNLMLHDLYLSAGPVSTYSPSLSSWAAKKMRGHTSSITAVHVDPCSSLIASASHDCIVKLRRFNFPRLASSLNSHSNANNPPNISLRGHGSPVRWIDRASQGLYATHGCSDARLKLWDAHAATCVNTVKLPYAIDVAKAVQGSSTASPADIYVAAGPSVHVVDTRMQGVACILSLPRAWVGGINRLGAMTVDHTGTVAAAVGEAGVVIWDSRGSWEGRPIGSLTNWNRKSSSSSSQSQHYQQLSTIAFVKNSAIVAAAPHGNELLTFGRNGTHTGSLHIKDEAWRAQRRNRRRRRSSTDPSMLDANRTTTSTALSSHDEDATAITALDCVHVGTYDDDAIVVTRRNGAVSLIDLANSPVDWDAAVDAFADMRDAESNELVNGETSGRGTNGQDGEDGSQLKQFAYAKEQSKRFWNSSAYLAQSSRHGGDK